MELVVHIVGLFFAVVALFYAIKANRGKKADTEHYKAMLLCQVSFVVSIIARYPKIAWHEWAVLAGAIVIFVLCVKNKKSC